MSHVVSSFSDVEGVGGIGAYHGAVLCPVDEGIARSGRSGEGNRSAIVVCTPTRHRSALCRVGGDSDVEALKLEVGDVGGRLSDCDRAWVGGDSVTPTSEGVARVGCCSQCAARALHIGASAAHVTTCSWVGSNCDGEGLNFSRGKEYGIAPSRFRICVNAFNTHAIITGRIHAGDGVWRVPNGNRIIPVDFASMHYYIVDCEVVTRIIY